jgi:hypothetical protein
MINNSDIQYPFTDPAPFEIFDIVRKNKILGVENNNIYFRIPDSVDGKKYRILSLSVDNLSDSEHISDINYAGNCDLYLHTMDKYTLINSTKNLLKPAEVTSGDPEHVPQKKFSERNLGVSPTCVIDNRGKLRRSIGIFTTPIFGALRRFVAWGDQKYGSCDVSLSVVPRGLEANTGINHSINHIDDTLSATEFYAKYAEEE